MGCKLPAPSRIFGLESIRQYYRNRNIDKLNFVLNPTTEETVLKHLQNINASKASGLDKLAGKFLKEGASILAAPIKEICNLSIKNYRPISLLPLVSKIIEKIIHEQVDGFLRNHNIIYKYQSGFRTNHSTNSCLSYLSNKIQNGIEEGKFTGMILIDLQKAFDTIDHEILLLKMKYLGFAESTINWFRSYLE